MEDFEDQTPITDKQMELMRSEALTAKERWVDMRIQSIERYRNLLIGNGDKEFNLKLTLLSISVAFLTIVVPLASNYSSPLFSFGLVFFFVSSVSGIIDLIWIIYSDRHYLQEDLKWNDDVHRELQLKASDFYMRLSGLGAPITKKDVNDYLDKNNYSKKEQERFESRKTLLSMRTLRFLHWLFLISFFLGFGFLILAVGGKVIFQSQNSISGEFSSITRDVSSAVKLK